MHGFIVMLKLNMLKTASDQKTDVSTYFWPYCACATKYSAGTTVTFLAWESPVEVPNPDSISAKEDINTLTHSKLLMN